MAASRTSSDTRRSGPIGKGVPEEHPGALPAEPSHGTPSKEQGRQDKKVPASGQARKHPANEEPELALEPDLPSDGRDEVGEAMIRNLPQRPELSEPPSQPKRPGSSAA